MFVAGVASSSTVGQETWATFYCGECSRIRRFLFVRSGLRESSSLITVGWVSVEGIMDILCIHATALALLHSVS